MPENKPVLFTIFGATGDLAQRKLYPSLFRLFRKGDLAENFAVIGTARRPWSNEHYREIIKENIASLNPTTKEAEAFSQHFFYQSHDVQDTDHYVALKQLTDQLDQQFATNGNRLYYLAMSPNFFGTIVGHLKSEKFLSSEGFHRVIIEKPFGTDFESAEKLNQAITSAFAEDEVYRIDHYLGKEMIQNILAVRFANHLFESVWNKQYIDNVQITLAESLGVEERGGYYDHSGALKDMVQNHILQILALLAMEPPVAFNDQEIRTEKIKALNSIRIYTEEEVQKNFVRGQYDTGQLAEQTFNAYRNEPNVATDSQTETFVAGKFQLDNTRWSGVPFFIRTGKHLTEKGTRINIVFKQTPLNLFTENNSHATSEQGLPNNVLTIYIQPTEGFSLTLNGKEIGQGYNTVPVKLDYRNSTETVENSPEAYERLIFDTLNGDSTNFSHWEEVAQSWQIVDVIRKTWDQVQPAFPNYAAGTMGPDAAFELLEKDDAHWVWQPDQWYRQHDLLN
ncbi:MAG: glucose-6-phosphate dehydrogenase [Enterococcus sp.]